MHRQSHHNELLAAGRCGRCAEEVSRAAILGQRTCEHCGADLSFEGGQMLDALAEHQNRWRLVGYGLIAMASLLAGLIPLLQVVVQVIGLFVLHALVLRAGLKWLPPLRRILAQVTMKVLAGLVVAAAVVVNTGVAPLVGLGAAVLAVSGPLLTAMYVETSLVVLRRRLKWQARSEGMRISEWVIPVALLVVLGVAVAAVAMLVAGAAYLVSESSLPGIAQITEWLLEVLP